MDTPALPQGERRQNSALRSLFDTAYALIEPFMDPDAGWAGHSLEHLAYRLLRDNFPELSASDVNTIVVASHRLYIQRHPHRSDHLKRPDELRHS